ncbi:MAG: hypothetical protein NT075_09370 [Chloroflexi bacterium]|nr:hypothetical protein [Chloroflexota bacterium]
MNYFRQIIEELPETIIAPPELRHRRVEIIILPLDEVIGNGKSTAVDANGWPLGFFEETEGRWAGEPLVREPQGEYETRLEFE